MASVSGVSNSNMSSLYGNRNVLSGLASGMDTESMIENSVSGIRFKISGIQQKQTKLQWKQEAYQGVTDTLIQFSRKYTSYSSATNLLSPSFFNKAVLTTTGGANASKVSASGRSTSNVQINGVAQLASNSRYQVGYTSGGSNGVLGEGLSIEAGSSINLEGTTTSSNLTGSLTLKYGSKTIDLTFSESDFASTATPPPTQEELFVAAINKKLAEQKITTSSGTAPASDSIEAKLDGGKVTFSDKKSASGNQLYIEGASGKLAEVFKDINFSDADKRVSSLDLTGKTLTTQISTMESIAGKTMSFTLDGVSKSITLPTKEEINKQGGNVDKAFTDLLQKKIDIAFGSAKIKVADQNGSADTSVKLSFTINQGSSLSISSDVNETLGLDKFSSSYLNTSKTLGDLIADPSIFTEKIKGKGTPIKQADDTFRDQEGNTVDSDGFLLDKKGNHLLGAKLKINGQEIGTYHRDSTLESVMLAINNNTNAGVSLNYSKVSNQFVFAAKDTGAGHSISYDNGGLAEQLFGKFDSTAAKASEGKDAIVNMTVNGENLTVTRSSNTFDVDGMSVTVKETFNFTNTYEQMKNPDGTPMTGTDGKPVYDMTKPIFDVKDPVTFTSSADEDKVVAAIKDMVKDYNNIVTELRKAFNTLPAKNANGKKYEPLTDKDRESMSESAIKSYEEKAKQGLLFGDQDLSSLYSKLVSSISPSGTDGTTLRNMGITTDYSQGLTTLNLDETKLRDMLKSNPDTVRDAFTKVAGEGSGTDGLMKKLKTTLDTYSSVEGTKGILINKAGSKYSALSLLKNSMKDQMDAYEKQVDKLQDTLSTKVDYYTRQFTRLEQLISQMNSQSSYIAGMGG